MNFDRLGEQQVLKRRRPSPVRKARHTASSLETGFAQDVWPRHKRREPVSVFVKFDKIRQSIFGGISPGNVEKPKKRKRRARQRAENVFETTYSATTEGDSVNGVFTNSEPSRRFFDLGQHAPLLKKLALALGLLVTALVGLNWDGVSGIFAQRQEIPHVWLEDPVSPLQQRMTSEFSPARSLSANPYHGEYYWPLHTDIPINNLTETFYWTYYVVVPGDTISGIAAQNSLSQGSIIALNDIRETWNLRIGRTLKIPNMDGIPYTVRANDTLGGIAQSMGVPLNVLLDANNLYSDNLVPGQVLFIPGGRMDSGDLRRAIWRTPDRPLLRPVPGRITSGFGWREDPFRPGSGRMELHRAVDLAGRTGDPIMAAMAGTVVHRGANATLGNFLVLRHGEHYQTLYAHLSAFSVAEGATVRQGQEIGRIGSTGRATGPHLHFAVFYRGEAVNPVDRWR